MHQALSCSSVASCLRVPRCLSQGIAPSSARTGPGRTTSLRLAADAAMNFCFSLSIRHLVELPSYWKRFRRSDASLPRLLLLPTVIYWCVTENALNTYVSLDYSCPTYERVLSSVA